ncbi:DUF2407 ubiquitin-like domain-containing protein [Triangularia setosa]|uniref:DUF2407 ubiquitin-like domain-containing protein n=1 Tax=Triangularia setosa TaxID=2587417 RepID=A0AAN6WCG3_9PEZI|nr:DUF2407 ubiquitin-like domain-containing protein [Podospora setosa]
MSSSSKLRPKRDTSVSSSSSSSSSSPIKPSAPLLLSAPTARSKSPLPPPTPPLHITIRFSTSLPDLELDIPSPSTTTVVALKHLIRQRLTPSTGSKSNLRFIHNGRILPDSSPLSTVFKSLPPPPPANPDIKGKGKDVIFGEQQQQRQRVFVNCSIGHVLGVEELKDEESAATKPATPAPAAPTPATHQANGREPRGFDRLAGSLTREEILNLRLTFRGYHAARYTPDSMPSAERMLELEDAWLDNGSGGGFTQQDGGSGEGTGTGEEEGEGWAGNVDLLVKGMAIGFIFPMGVVGWLLREEGLWSKRMGVFVSLGVLLGVVVGFVREFPGH